jgi:GTP-binding protein
MFYEFVGKSSLLSALSHAKPKIANYPFTTLQPIIGAINTIDNKASNMTIADLPGLIKGAAHNRGLGHAFLRHIERCKVLIFVLDLTATEHDVNEKEESNSIRDPCIDFLELQKELILYNPTLLNKPKIIFANKRDCDTQLFQHNLNRLNKLLGRNPDFTIFTGSAKLKEGTQQLTAFLTQFINKTLNQ